NAARPSPASLSSPADPTPHTSGSDKESRCLGGETPVGPTGVSPPPASSSENPGSGRAPAPPGPPTAPASRHRSPRPSTPALLAWTSQPHGLLAPDAVPGGSRPCDADAAG